jgi:hypothetical protein
MFNRGAMRFWVADRHPFLTLPPRGSSGPYDATELKYDVGVHWFPILDIEATISWNCDATQFVRTMGLKRGGSSSVSPPGYEFFNPAEANLRMSLRGAQENFKPGRLTLELTIPRFTSMRRDIAMNVFDPSIPTVFPPLTQPHDRWTQTFGFPSGTATGMQMYALAMNGLIEAAYYHYTVFIVGTDSPGAPRDLLTDTKPTVRGRLPWGSSLWSFPAKAISITDNSDRFTIQFAATNDIQRRQNGYIITVPKFIRIPAFDAFEEDILAWDVIWHPIELEHVYEELL